jgi:hypothetical protein
MASIPGGVPVLGFMSPNDDLDTYPVIDPIYGIDGLRSVADNTERDAITAQRRREGMLVYTQDSNTYWQLAADLTTWVETNIGVDPLDHIDFAETPVVTGQPRRLMWNATDGTLDLGMNNGNVTQQIGLEQFYRVKASAAITNGQCVMATGTQGNSGVILAAPSLNPASPEYIIGVATEDIALGDFGFITCFGKVRGIQTNGANYGETWVDGTVLYANTASAGRMTSTRPDVDPVIVAIVVNAHGSNGELFIRVTHDGVRWDRVSGKPTTSYVATFNATTDWGSASGGYYTITIAAATHALTNTPSIVQIYELVGSDYDLVNVDRVRIASNGDVSIRVVSSPDLRFAGRISIA